MPNAPTPFQHLQTSNNPSPSPTIPQMNFNQGGPTQRSTVSPSPFSPQQPGPHPSPGPSDHASRGGTPHDNAQNFMQNPAFGAGFAQQQLNPGMANGMNPMMMNAQMMAQQNMSMNPAQRNYHMQLQAQARQLSQARQQQGMQAMASQQVPDAMAQMQQGMVQQKPKNPEEFTRNLQAYMAARGRSVNLTPTICGRPIMLVQLYAAVVKNGGSQRIAKLGQWMVVAAQLGFPPQQQQQAAQELHNYWISNFLNLYENAWQMQQQKQRMAQAQMQGQAGAQMSPTRDQHAVQDPSQPGHQRQQSDMLNPKLANQLQNGFMPSTPQVQATPQHRSSLSRQFDPSQVPNASPQRAQQGEVAVKAEPEGNMPPKKPIVDPFVPEVLPPSKYHGPINIEEILTLGQGISDLKPTAPAFRELGVIDIHALTMAIKSGMHAETRVALDTLVTLSTEPQLQLALTECDDLMDTLVDCAQDQVDFLSEHSPEVSDEMSLTPYEDLVRGCKADIEQLQDVPEFGTVEYDLDRAADRLICITTLIRNFSFSEANFIVLGQPEILKMISTVIRFLGTRENILRNSKNTLDFMKDVVIYLSNLSTHVNIPGKEEALCLLHFLLAFAPCPAPMVASTGRVCFTSYNPNIHKYMPSAIDSLAKLLARDEPNRTYYKAIFAADAGSSPPYELLTRTFGLAIAAVPGSARDTRALIEARKPFLLQGMLAAEIVAGLAPTSENPLARSWLESDDGFAINLLRLVMSLSADKSTQMASNHLHHPPPQMPHGGRHQRPPEPDANAYGAITARAVAVLKALVQKSRTFDAEGGAVAVPAGVMPRKEKMLGAMVEKDIDQGILRLLCVYAGLED
jgi:SWI/SNF chromatin-remodeling complex subunit SWI1